MGRILIVEDDKGTREALGSALSVEGHDVLLAANGQEGLRMAVEGDVDLVVSDMRMPEMDGLSLLQGLLLPFRRRATGATIHDGHGPTVHSISSGVVAGATEPKSKSFRAI